MTTIISEVGHFTLPMKKRRNDPAVYRRRDSAASKKSEPVSGVCLLNGTLTERSGALEQADTDRPPALPLLLSLLRRTSEAAAGGPSKRDDDNEAERASERATLRWLGMHA